MCNPPIQLSFVSNVFPHGWDGFHLLIHKCPPETNKSSPEKNNQSWTTDDFLLILIAILPWLLYHTWFFTPKKLGLWKMNPILTFPQRMSPSAFPNLGWLKNQDLEVTRLPRYLTRVMGIFLWKNGGETRNGGFNLINRFPPNGGDLVREMGPRWFSKGNRSVGEIF